MEDFIRLLAQSDLFRCFSIEELSMMFKQNPCRIDSYSKNAVIHFQNEICTSLDVVLYGAVMIQRIDAGGDMLALCDFAAGDSIGENLLFSRNNLYPMTMTAKYDTKIIHIKKTIVLSLCQNNSDFLINFLQSVSDKTLILAGKIKTLSMKTIRQCIVEFLLYEYHVQKSTTIQLEVSKKELAEKLGVQRPSLSRELSKMRYDGVITFDAKSITIQNIGVLESMQTDI